MISGEKLFMLLASKNCSTRLSCFVVVLLGISFLFFCCRTGSFYMRDKRSSGSGCSL